MRNIGFTQEEIEFLEESALRIDVLANVSREELREADEERALIEAGLAELLINAAARAGVEV